MVKAFLDIHIVQSVPPSNINRDDTGAPKTAVYGGARRARVSSQAWKRAARKDFPSQLDASQLGVRTKRVVENLAARITNLAPELAESAEALASQVLLAVGIKTEAPRAKKGSEEHAAPEAGYLVFFSALQIDKAAKQAIEDHRSGTAPAKKVYKEILQSDNSLDIALFGRMIADLTDLGVDAAAQVAHALSVHAVESEADYFTAVDDEKEKDPDRDAGAGMIGVVEFNSSTLYRYATVSIHQLVENLGSTRAATAALDAFAQSFALSMPTGKANTFANQTVPAGVVFAVRTDRPVNLVGAFETPIPQGNGYVEPALAALTQHAQETDAAFSAPLGYWTAGIDSASLALDGLAERTDFATAKDAAVNAAMGSFSPPEENR